MPAHAKKDVIDWWGDEEPPTADEADMVAEQLEAHPRLTMAEALREIRLWEFVSEEAARFVPANRMSRRGRGP